MLCVVVFLSSLLSCLCFLCLPFFLFAPPIAILAFGCLCIFSLSKLRSLTQSVCCVCTVCFLPLLFICPFLLWLGDFYFLFLGRGAGGGAPHLFVALSTSMVLQPPCLKASSSPQQFWEDHWLASWVNWKNFHVNFDESGIYFRPWACTTTSSSLFWEVEKFKVQECAPALCNCCRIWESAFILGSYTVALCFVLLYPSSSLLFGDENLWPNLGGAKQSHSCNGLLVNMSAVASTWLMIVVQRVEQL